MSFFKRRPTQYRIACREIESWYLADLLAVERELGIKGLSQHQNKRKYRAPDYLHKSSEELRLLTNHVYQKVSGSRSIGPFLQLDNRRSNSFKVFVDGVRQVTNINQYMKLHFDSKQEFQLEAIKAIIDIFEGQPLSNGDFEFAISQSGSMLTENGVGNKIGFSDLDQSPGSLV